MTTEYRIVEPGAWPLARSDDGAIKLQSDQEIAARSTSGFFLSYGMTIALAELRWHLQRVMKTATKIIGDKGHSIPRGDRSIVVLGSPLNNRYLQVLLPDLVQRYPLLDKFAWEMGPTGVSLMLPDGRQVTPDVDDDENGYDYALVARMLLDPVSGKRLVMISGCNMWGTEAATNFVLDRRQLVLLHKALRRSPKTDAIAFVIKTTVSNGSPDRIELCPTAEGNVFFDLQRSYSAESGQPKWWMRS